MARQMHKMAIMPGIVIALLLGGVLSIAAPASASPQLSLRTSKAEYESTEPIVFEVTVSLAPGEALPVAVTTFPDGALRVQRLRRDGVRVKSSRSVVDFEQDPFLRAVEEAVALQPGASVAITYEPEPSEDGGSVIADLRPNTNGDSVVRLYPLSAPGLYTLRLRYRFRNRSVTVAPPLKKALLSNEVSFRVR